MVEWNDTVTHFKIFSFRQLSRHLVGLWTAENPVAINLLKRILVRQRCSLFSFSTLLTDCPINLKQKLLSNNNNNNKLLYLHGCEPMWAFNPVFISLSIWFCFVCPLANRPSGLFGQFWLSPGERCGQNAHPRQLEDSHGIRTKISHLQKELTTSHLIIFSFFQ